MHIYTSYYKGSVSVPGQRLGPRAASRSQGSVSVPGQCLGPRAASGSQGSVSVPGQCLGLVLTLFELRVSPSAAASAFFLRLVKYLILGVITGSVFDAL